MFVDLRKLATVRARSFRQEATVCGKVGPPYGSENNPVEMHGRFSMSEHTRPRVVHASRKSSQPVRLYEARL
jgi:hypothetical protein